MKHLLRNICILGALLVGISVFLVPESYLNVYDTNTVVPTVEIVQDSNPVVQKTTESVPVLLSIESVGMSAPIESVGILGKAMAVPTSSDSVGWYELGVRPGDIGSAVLAGHVNWYGGQDAVFSSLRDVAIGDVITVMDSEGTTVSFVVRETRRYQLHDDTREVFTAHDGRAHLRLITCDGPWNAIMGTHELRLVVFAEKIEEGTLSIE